MGKYLNKMKVRGQIIEAVKKATSADEIHLETPANTEHGDYATNIAMVMFGKIKNKRSKIENEFQNVKSPRELAEKIVSKLKKDKKLGEIVDLEKVEVAGPGFINFYITQTVLGSIIKSIYSDAERYGHSETKKDQKIVVEYTDPNPFKEFHIGHLISNVTGETLALLQESQGSTVWRADYFGDVGVHVAKSIWGIKKKMKEDGVSLTALSKKNLTDRVNFMGQGYAMGARAFKDDPEAQKEIQRLNTVLYMVAQKMWEKKGNKSEIDYDPLGKIPESEIEEVYALYTRGRKWSLEYFETIYEKLGTKFDGYYPESVVGEVGYKLVMDNVGKVFEKSQGAIVFPGEKFGLHTRVFVNKHNLPTYEAKELGLAPTKYKDFKYDFSIIVAGKEIKEYFEVLVEALKQVNPKLGNVTLPICHGMISLPEGQMSSRTGNVVTVNSLLDKLSGKIKERMEDQDYPDKEKDHISEKVAVGALKYAFLKNSVGSDFVFDMEAALSLDGNSGPYVQYTVARTNSVLHKAKFSVNNSQSPDNDQFFNNLEIEEESLLRHFVHFPEVVETAAENYAPNLLCNYLFELAQKYNTFYNKHSILGPTFKDQVFKGGANEGIERQIDAVGNTKEARISETRNFRMVLTFATGQILKNGLALLGIQAPDRM